MTSSSAELLHHQQIAIEVGLDDSSTQPEDQIHINDIIRDDHYDDDDGDGLIAHAHAHADSSDAHGPQQQTALLSHKDPWWKGVISGYTTGLIYVVVGHPFDTLKTRIQTGSTQHAFKHMYRGILPPLLTTPSCWTFNFWAYHTSLKLLGSDSLASIYCAGGLSGFVWAVCMCPPELIKCYAQRYHLTSAQSARAIYRQFDSSLYNFCARGLFRGLTATLVRDVPATAAYFWGLEITRRNLPGYGESQVLMPFVSGITAGVCCWTFALPGDCIKSIIQTEFASARSFSELPSASFMFNLKKLLAENNGNVLRLYNSALPVLVRAVVTSGLGVIGLENVSRKINAFIEHRGDFGAASATTTGKPQY